MAISRRLGKSGSAVEYHVSVGIAQGWQKLLRRPWPDLHGVWRNVGGGARQSHLSRCGNRRSRHPPQTVGILHRGICLTGAIQVNQRNAGDPTAYLAVLILIGKPAVIRREVNAVWPPLAGVSAKLGRRDAGGITVSAAQVKESDRRLTYTTGTALGAM